jgi:hypothetical protein
MVLPLESRQQLDSNIFDCRMRLSASPIASSNCCLSKALTHASNRRVTMEILCSLEVSLLTAVKSARAYSNRLLKVLLRQQRLAPEEKRMGAGVSVVFVLLSEREGVRMNRTGKSMTALQEAIVSRSLFSCASERAANRAGRHETGSCKSRASSLLCT